MTKNTVLYNLAFIVVGTVVSITVAILLVPVDLLEGDHQPEHGRVIVDAQVDDSRKHHAVALGREPIVWYQEKRYWPFLLVLAYLWKSVGFSMVIYLSSIVGISKEYYEAAAPCSWSCSGPRRRRTDTGNWQSPPSRSPGCPISKEYYEAARIDGAGKWKQIRFITLPLLKSTVITLLIMNIGSR